VRRAAAAHKTRIRLWLEGLARDAGAPDPAQLAGDLALIKEGLIVATQVSGAEPAITAARRMAATTIAMAFRE
jgi:hypothetical protein